MLALIYHKIDNNHQRISNIIPYVANYNCNEIDFFTGPKEYNAFEKYNDNIALNLFYIPHNEKDIRPVYIYIYIYISKYNKTCNYHANLLMITNGKDKFHYIAIRSITRCNIYS